MQMVIKTGKRQMASNGKNHDGTFAKGNQLAKGHGYGRPRLTPEEKALSIATRKEFQMLLSKYSTWTLQEVENQLQKNKDLPILDMAVLRHLKNMNEVGSMERVDWTLDHIMGSRPKESTININSGQTLDLRSLSPEKLEMVRQLLNGEEGDNGASTSDS